MPNLLKKARLKHGLSRFEVAQAINSTVAHVGHLECGRRKPSPAKALALEKLLGVDKSLILPGVYPR